MEVVHIKGYGMICGINDVTGICGVNDGDDISDANDTNDVDAYVRIIRTPMMPKRLMTSMARMRLHEKLRMNNILFLGS